MKKIVVGFVTFLIVVIVIAIAVGNPEEPVASPEPQPTATEAVVPQEAPSAPEPAATVAPEPVEETPLVDEGWSVDSYSLDEDFTGSFGGSARITNASSDGLGAAVTFTILDGDTIVATLIGNVGGLVQGETGTVQLISTDTYTPRTAAHVVDFQVDYTL